jgi:hypothetical protein
MVSLGTTKPSDFGDEVMEPFKEEQRTIASRAG